MKKELALPFILFIPIAVLQYAFVPLISFGGVAPDFILVLLVFYSLKLGQLKGTVVGFAYGFFTDIFTGGVLGSAMFAKTLSGFIAGYFSNENKIDLYLGSFFFLFIILICGIVDSIAFSFFSGKEIYASLAVLIFEHGLLPALYSSLMGLPIIMFYPSDRIL